MPELHYVRSDLINNTAVRDEDFLAMNIERDMGKLEAIVQNLEHSVKDYTRQREEDRRERDALKEQLRAEMKEIQDLILQIKTGSRVILWFGALISGGVGTVLVKFFPVLLR